MQSAIMNAAAPAQGRSPCRDECDFKNKVLSRAQPASTEQQVAGLSNRWPMGNSRRDFGSLHTRSQPWALARCAMERMIVANARLCMAMHASCTNQPWQDIRAHPHPMLCPATSLPRSSQALPCPAQQAPCITFQGGSWRVGAGDVAGVKATEGKARAT